MKPATKRFAGRSYERLRRPDLLEHAVVHDRDPVAHRHRLDLVVRDVDRGRADLLLQAPDLAARLRAQLGVEVRQRLVHQERPAARAPARGPAPRAAPARRRAGPAGGRAARRCRARPPPPGRGGGSLARHLPPPQPEREVVEHGHLRVQRVVLEDHRDVALARRDLVHDPRRRSAPRPRDRLEPREHPQRGRLARAGRPDEHHELAVGDLQREARARPRRGRSACRPSSKRTPAISPSPPRRACRG